MQGVQLGKKNEPVEWSSDDEIGALVKEYNRMLSQAEKSAELLARSERESAWREMAKQVAHEIKNPLTPMKLRIQHLERAWKDEAPNFDEKMKVFSESLIEQIDTLTNIANEFSNFAKMPKAQNEAMNLDQVLKATVSLFHSKESFVLSYTSQMNGEANIHADKEQIIRVFNNLITNAIQAIPESQEGKIEVFLRREDDYAVVEVRDNGSGIPAHEQEKIFVPNFTTKSTGTGLGLAMVKNIVENAEGKVWFHSKEKIGSVFFVSFPLILTD
jgi:two-component system nitrogen regulation sensor histidine kinase NtrY